jgi:hypothetical protein
MAVDYSQGRYTAYGIGPDGPRVGWIDHDEFVRSDNGTWLFRIEGEEIYSSSGKLAGFLEDDVASSLSGHFLFRLEKD